MLSSLFFFLGRDKRSAGEVGHIENKKSPGQGKNERLWEDCASKWTGRYYFLSKNITSIYSSLSQQCVYLDFLNVIVVV